MPTALQAPDYEAQWCCRHPSGASRSSVVEAPRYGNRERGPCSVVDVEGLQYAAFQPWGDLAEYEFFEVLGLTMCVERIP
jgi:hypothetical protein